jgi:hypothetical protein
MMGNRSGELIMIKKIKSAKIGKHGSLYSSTLRCILLVVIIGVSGIVPAVCAYHNTGDLINDFLYYSNACKGYANAVWVDTDGIVNGATYGKYDTMVVFETVSGLGYPDSSGGEPEFYFFTATQCSGPQDRGRIVIYFVDMLAAGFNQNTPSTWTFKSVPKIYISAGNDGSVCDGKPYDSAYEYVQAYKNRYQNGAITGVIEPDPGPGPYRDYYFYDPAGIKELYVSTDFCENSLNNFQIETGAQPNSITVISPNGAESWERGTTHEIQWTRTGTMSSNTFNIYLLKGGTVSSFIGSFSLDLVHQTQSYSWTIPAGQTLGSDYQIRVTDSGSLPYTDSSNAVFTIIAKSVVKPLPGFVKSPTDPDHDGIYEDLNSNDRLDFADVVLYFNQMEWIAANEPVKAFDLNGNGRIDFADIVRLFGEI